MFGEKFFYNNQLVTILICAKGLLVWPMQVISASGLLKCYGRRQKMAEIEIPPRSLTSKSSARKAVDDKPSFPYRGPAN